MPRYYCDYCDTYLTHDSVTSPHYSTISTTLYLTSNIASPLFKQQRVSLQRPWLVIHFWSDRKSTIVPAALSYMCIMHQTLNSQCLCSLWSESNTIQDTSTKLMWGIITCNLRRPRHKIWLTARLWNTWHELELAILQRLVFTNFF